MIKLDLVPVLQCIENLSAHWVTGKNWWQRPFSLFHVSDWSRCSESEWSKLAGLTFGIVYNFQSYSAPVFYTETCLLIKNINAYLLSEQHVYRSSAVSVQFTGFTPVCTCTYGVQSGARAEVWKFYSASLLIGRIIFMVFCRSFYFITYHFLVVSFLSVCKKLLLFFDIWSSKDWKRSVLMYFIQLFCCCWN